MELIGRGRDTDVYALDGDRVLRRYRDGDGPTERESRLMAHLAEYGYPVPKVYEYNDTDMVMDRVQGPTMMSVMTRRPWRFLHFGRMLADLHNRLHEIPAPDWLPRAGDRGDRVIHLDLHPDNVMLTENGPVVIDWCTAKAGEPELDIASLVVLFKAMQPPVPWIVRRMIAVAKAPLLAAFLTSARHEPTDEQVYSVIKWKLNDPNLNPAELSRLRAWSERIA